MANFLVIDKDDNALAVVTWNDQTKLFKPQDGFAGLVQYDGPFWAGAHWDGEKLIDPNPPEPITVGEVEVTRSTKGGPNVIS